jgi:hypothetical protein
MAELSNKLFALLTATNEVMSDTTFAKDDKDLVKVNRFRKWLLSYSESKGLLK